MVNEDFLQRTPFNLIAEIKLDKIKSIVILATVVHIPPVQEWHYFGCRRCSKSLTNKETPSDTDDLYECPNEGLKDVKDWTYCRFPRSIFMFKTLAVLFHQHYGTGMLIKY